MHERVHECDRNLLLEDASLCLSHCKDKGIPKNPGVMDTSKLSPLDGETVMGAGCVIL